MIPARTPQPEAWVPPPVFSGRYRDVYAPGEPTLVIVTSDRVSAFDVVLPTEIPDKGKILTQLSLWWFEQLSDVVANHLITADVDHYPSVFRQRDDWRGRSMLVRKLGMVQAECVGRAYLAGSATKLYQATGSVCGIVLPGGLQEGDLLPTPLFTPTTKAAVGEHDEPITFEELEAAVGENEAAEVRHITMSVLERARAICEARGLLVADTKVELGRNVLGRIVLGDEVLTPDSSRFWLKSEWRPGQAQVSFDKQPLRDWLLHTARWDKRPETAPELPEEIVAATRNRYIMAYELITGEKWR
jgi:phosphoribosylaminoimidazole-succinocarboxamide synthase